MTLPPNHRLNESELSLLMLAIEHRKAWSWLSLNSDDDEVLNSAYRKLYLQRELISPLEPFEP